MLVSELIDRTLNQWLYPAGVNRPSYDVLATGIDDVTKSLTLQGLITVPRDSILELGNELILTEAVEGSTITANERGYLDTVPTTHLAGTRVYLDPRYSRKSLFDILCSVIGDLAPWVYQRVVDETKTYTTHGAMDLPTGTLELLNVRVKNQYAAYNDYSKLKPDKHFEVMYEFTPPKIRFVQGANEDDILTLVVSKDFVLPTSEADDLTSVCGVSAGLAPHLALAVAGQILQSQELPRVVLDQIRRLLAQQGVQVGSALNVGQALKSMFDQKVAVERRRLRRLDPPEIEIVR